MVWSSLLALLKDYLCSHTMNLWFLDLLVPEFQLLAYLKQYGLEGEYIACHGR